MLSKTAQYAIRALVYIQMQNKKNKRPGFKEIAKETEAPEHFTAKILQTLTRYDMIESAKGRGGGFFFDPIKEELNLYEVIRVMEGEKYFNQCLFGFNFCDDKYPCPLHNDFLKIWDEFKELAKTQTIQSLAQKIDDQQAVLNRPK
jgi:Rrf2 family protein